MGGHGPAKQAGALCRPQPGRLYRSRDVSDPQLWPAGWAALRPRGSLTSRLRLIKPRRIRQRMPAEWRPGSRGQGVDDACHQTADAG